jgi:hypothetical protein
MLVFLEFGGEEQLQVSPGQICESFGGLRRQEQSPEGLIVRDRLTEQLSRKWSCNQKIGSVSGGKFNLSGQEVGAVLGTESSATTRITRVGMGKRSFFWSEKAALLCF